MAGANATDAKGNYRFSWVDVAASPKVTTYATFMACHTYLTNTPQAKKAGMPDKAQI